MLVDPLKPETISAAMSRLLHDQHLRAELIEKGLSRAASFTWDRTAAQLISIYESVLKSNA